MDNIQTIAGTIINVASPGIGLMLISGVSAKISHIVKATSFNRRSERLNSNAVIPAIAEGITNQADISCVADRMAVTQHNGINIKAKEIPMLPRFFSETAYL
ncbi:hypothetical protein QUB63_15950 [Microcoleus sp. ARI1-B5]|uniref:hypothetical protein n=1 Tax=Microcoleus sp. ARI1-A4 TaxID=2818559 RepID=UPI002FD492FD